MIPIYINNFNWLTSTRRMVEYLRAIPEADPIIVDNASTYPRLLEWYESQCPVRVVRLPTNTHGIRGVWDAVMDLPKKDYFVVTDSDLSLEGVPRDMLDVLQAGLERHGDVAKCGLSIETKDVPDGYPMRGHVLDWEQQFWRRRRDRQFWEADIETTFAMYRGRRWQFCYSPSLRADRPYTARHLPWYLTPRTMDDEARYYHEHIAEHLAPLAHRRARALLE